ncbi:hypothetical protein D047_0055B, partial [Vibrio parahaemolyticus VPTS-2010_2]
PCAELALCLHHQSPLQLA